jgi:hypothetical protein
VAQCLCDDLVVVSHDEHVLAYPVKNSARLGHRPTEAYCRSRRPILRSWSSHDGIKPKLPKLGVAGSNPVRRSERSPGFARLRSRGFLLRVHQGGLMQRVMQEEALSCELAWLCSRPRLTMDVLLYGFVAGH